MRRDFEYRVARCQRIENPSRPRRGSRGHYKRSSHSTPAWGLAGCRRSKVAKEQDDARPGKKRHRQEADERHKEEQTKMNKHEQD